MYRLLVKRFLNVLRPNPFDRLLKKASRDYQKRFLIVWNRGMGDIPLGLYALVYRIRQYIPDASITFITRSDLSEVFQMLDDVKVLIVPSWSRGKPIDVLAALRELSLGQNMFDIILERPDPTKWTRFQLGKLTPKLTWHDKWDVLSYKYGLDPNKKYIACHISTETQQYYRYEKNWSVYGWRELFKKIGNERNEHIILLGVKKETAFLMDHVIDLRGETSCFDMLSVIMTHCEYLVAPDSGVLSTVYYVNKNYPINIVSLWSDSNQGVLRQNVKSPNELCTHTSIKGKHGLMSSISSDDVYNALFCV